MTGINDNETTKVSDTEILKWALDNGWCVSERVLFSPWATSYVSWHYAIRNMRKHYEEIHKPKPEVVTAWDVTKGKRVPITEEEADNYSAFLNDSSAFFSNGPEKNFYALFRLAQAEADRINKQNGLE